MRLSIISESYISLAKRICFVERFDWIVEVMLLSGYGARKLGETSTLFRPTEIEFLDLVEPPGEGYRFRDFIFMTHWTVNVKLGKDRNILS